MSIKNAAGAGTELPVARIVPPHKSRCPVLVGTCTGTYDEVMGKQGGISLKGAASAMMGKLHKVDVFSEVAHHGVAALAAVADEVSSPVLFYFLRMRRKSCLQQQSLSSSNNGNNPVVTGLIRSISESLRRKKRKKIQLRRLYCTCLLSRPRTLSRPMPVAPATPTCAFTLGGRLQTAKRRKWSKSH